VARIPDAVWAPAYDAGGQVRDGAWVAEVTDLLDLSTWPTGMRVIVRKERPHPGAQLRLTDADGHRLTGLATNTPPGAGHGQLADRELRHRRRARAEDRIRCAKDTGLANLLAARLHPKPDLVRPRLAGLRADCVDADAGAGRPPRPTVEPKRLRLRLFSIPCGLAVSARRTVLHLARTSRWTGLLIDAIARLRAPAVPG
jgi:hypothetical protein